MTLKTRPPVLEKGLVHHDRIAVRDAKGEWTYGQLLAASRRIASGLLAGRPDLEEARIAFQVPPGFDCVALLWGIWAAGGIAVPVGLSYPVPEIRYQLLDSEADSFVFAGAVDNQLAGELARRKIPVVDLDQLLCSGETDLPGISPERRAMILYTSGTTSKPKGVVTTHQNIAAQIASLVEAWDWTDADRILNPLPLHHVHGIVNVLSCALWVGATCELPPRFDAQRFFRLLSTGKYSLFMAVPTIYVRLISAWNSAEEEERASFSEACSKMRLMVSGSAALPVNVFREWEAITGHPLLERYGMTEIGMALSNPLRGPRKPGFVGMPLPGVEVKIVDERGAAILGDGVSGELYVRGSTVFKEYWRRERETLEAFAAGWFRTGDVGIREEGYYRILGRSSVDIIKTGGYKVSALEIEEELRNHPGIKECAVVGVPDEEWGERVSAAIVAEAGAEIQLGELQEWASVRLARQKVPSRLVTVGDLPRNAMGKVVKPAVKKLFELKQDGVLSRPADHSGTDRAE